VAYLLFILYLFLNVVAAHRWDGDPVISPDPVVALLALFFAFLSSERPRDIPGINVQIFFAILFFGWFYMSSVVNESSVRALEYTSKGFLLYIIASFAIVNVKQFKIVMLAFVPMALVIAVNGILTIDYDSGFVPLELSWGYRLNWINTYDDSNSTAMFLNIAITVLFVHILESKAMVSRLISIVPMIILGYAVKLTDSRAGLLEMLVSIIVILYLKFGIKKTMLYASPIMIAVLSVFAGRMMEINTDDSSAQNRMVFWSRAFEYLWDQPILGLGYTGLANTLGMQGHNTFVEIYTESGLPGYVFFMGMYYIAAKGLFSTLGELKKNEQLAELAPILYIISGVTAAILVGAWFNTIYHELIYIWLGIWTAVYRLAYKITPNVGIEFGKQDFIRLIMVSMGVMVLIRVFIHFYI